MKQHEIPVEVQGDHLARLAGCTPWKALAELIWNSLDADASQVIVRFERNSLGGVEAITVDDDGTGLLHADEDVGNLFKRLGGSWKRTTRRTAKSGRDIHGQEGEGRFKAFALGDSIEWTSRSLVKGRVQECKVRGHRNAASFTSTELIPVEAETGTNVRIWALDQKLRLSPDAIVDKLCQELALYLRRYSGVRVDVDGITIDPGSLLVRQEDLSQLSVEVDGQAITINVTVVEWQKLGHTRALWLCDASGFPLTELPPGIQAPGLSFTAYVKSGYFRHLFESNLLDVGLAPGRSSVLETVKEQLRDYSRRRLAERAQSSVERWRIEDVYPYAGSTNSPVEEAERQVFNICALNLSEHMPDFEKSDAKQKRLAFRLVREAIERNPGSLQTILVEVLGLSKEKQDELAQLLRQTKLSAIINAAKLVSDRLTFLVGLEDILFEPESKRRLLERKQLHKLLANNTWIFGEEFSLTVNDESLTTALKRHVELQGRSFADDEPIVTREDGSSGVLDLMLTRLLLQPHTQKREHLVVELKRPSQTIDKDVVNQIESYAFAVVEDDRFRDVETIWRFVAISDELSSTTRRLANQSDRPRGQIYLDKENRVTISVLTWSEIIQQARSRLEFFRDALEHDVTTNEARRHLAKMYSKYLPASAANEQLELSIAIDTPPETSSKPAESA